MQVPVAATAATDRDGRTATSAFVLSRPHGTVSADGIDDRFDSAAAAVAGLRAGRVTAIVGALPFDSGHPAALTAPRRLVRSAAPYPVATAPDLPPIRVTATLPAESDHIDRVRTALNLLRSAGDRLTKVVLARTLLLTADRPVAPETLLAALVARDTAGNGYAVDLSAAGGPWTGRYLIGSSPEVLVRRRGDRVTAHPLAGSAPRHRDPAADRAAADALRDSAKNLHEHAHVVDSLRASLAPLCADLDIPARPTLMSTPHLWHLGTPVSGRLRDRATTALDLALAVHPPPAICGTPTARARAVIGELEGDRGFYAGALGWCDAHGDGEWMVTIRGAVLDADGTTLTAHAGGGIVAESDPADELAETTTKFGTVLGAWGVHR